MTQWLALNTDVDTVGWTWSPNRRGTFDILWNCAQTIALCAWSTVCVNVPQHGTWDMLRDKFHFVLLTLLGPEIVFLLAFAQFQSARASVKQFHHPDHDGKYDDWTLTHAFYADMGAIHVNDPDWKSFPVNAAQLHYLVTNGYLPYPDLDIKDIKARGRADKLGRVITIGQTLYFALTTFARLSQGLCITTMELTVLGFIFPSIANCIGWWYKPNDVDDAHVFNLTVSVEEILLKAGADASEVYRNTPLDFVAHEEWAGLNLWTYYVNILRQLWLFPKLHKEIPIQRIPSLNFPNPKSKHSALVALSMGTAYCAIFFGAWNFYFPTRLEQLLWRIFCSLQCAICFCAGTFEITLFDDYCRPGTGVVNDAGESGRSEETHEKPHHLPHTHPQFNSTLRRLWNRPCSNSSPNYKRLEVPLKSLLVTTPLCAAYCVCRWFLLLEDLVNLRSLPLSAYVTPNWTIYLPRF